LSHTSIHKFKIYDLRFKIYCCPYFLVIFSLILILDLLLQIFPSILNLKSPTLLIAALLLQIYF